MYVVDYYTVISEPGFFLGRDKITKWNKNSPSTNVRNCRHNTVLHLPEVKQIARDTKLVLDCWKLSPCTVFKFFKNNRLLKITLHVSNNTS